VPVAAKGEVVVARVPPRVGSERAREFRRGNRPGAGWRKNRWPKARLSFKYPNPPAKAQYRITFLAPRTPQQREVQGNAVLPGFSWVLNLTAGFTGFNDLEIIHRQAAPTRSAKTAALARECGREQFAPVLIQRQRSGQGVLLGWRFYR